MRQTTRLLLWATLLDACHAAASAAQPQAACTATALYADGQSLTRHCAVESGPHVGTNRQRAGGDASQTQQGNTIAKAFEWLKETRWLWNNWRDVVFRADGSFLAPANGCEKKNARCRWYTDNENVYVEWADAGLHTLQADEESGEIVGARDSDGEEVHAVRR